jgi:thiol-disulfide isomerase/thioredoxin
MKKNKSNHNHRKLKFLISLLFLTLFSNWGYTQYAINGNFPPLKNQTIRLIGFDGLNNYLIDSVQVSSTGSFILKYNLKDLGIGYITDVEKKSYLVILEKEGVELKGEAISAPESIVTLKGAENNAFINYATQHAKREQALSAWTYLQNIYQVDALFSNQLIINESIASEIQRIEKQDHDFLSSLPNTSYVYWYLPLRKLISSVSIVAQYRSKEIPETINALRKIDFSDARLYKSGLLRDAIESHFWLLENRGGITLDSIFKDMNISTDHVLKNITKNEILYNDITKYLFEYFEKHSLFQASEYLALKALNQKTVKLNANLQNQLESYRSMKIGNIAPNIFFTGDVLKNGIQIKSPLSLSEVSSNFKVVIFGASWCPSCVEEMSQLLPLYSKWKSKGVEVIFISMDTDSKAFHDYTKSMQFISSCDYKKWDTKAAKDYFVSSSPTFYLLDKKNKIILRPKMVKAIDTWIDYNMEGYK